MSKAVLVLGEMPIGCRYCPLEHEEEYVCVYSGLGTLNSQLERPDFCPLRPLPERKQADLYDGEYHVGRAHGWNDCLRAIEGSGEDETSDSEKQRW